LQALTMTAGPYRGQPAEPPSGSAPIADLRFAQVYVPPTI
jgi:hypothetical protein